MKCQCKVQYLLNCECKIYDTDCSNKLECCWCCVYQEYCIRLEKVDFYNKLKDYAKIVLNDKKEDKIIKKSIKTVLKDIEQNNILLKKVLNKNYLQLIDSKEELNTIALTIEEDKFLKLEYVLIEMQNFLELTNWLIQLKIDQIIKDKYESVYHYINLTDNFLSNFAKLFIQITKNIDNSIEYSEIKEKLIDVDNQIENLKLNLNLKKVI